MVSMSLPHSSEESGSSYVLRRNHHRRDADGYLFTSAHSRVSVFRAVKLNLLVQDNTQEGRVDVQPAIVPNEAQFLEFIHEEIDPGARCPDHFRQSLLRYFGEPFFEAGLAGHSERAAEECGPAVSRWS